MMKNSRKNLDDLLVVIDFVVANFAEGKIFVQKRSPHRKLFPNCWELAGGHLEQGESEEDCIRRELLEECGMQLERVIKQLHEFYWYNDQRKVQDKVYLVTASGVYIPEYGKISDFRWINKSEVDILLREGESENELHTSALKAFAYMENFEN